MRTIKFRGKNRDRKEWLYGDIIQYNHCSFGIDGEYVDPDSVGQFTGLLDKNGKEIYENDIVRYYDDVEDELVVRPVEYLNDYCAFCAVHPQNDPDGLFAQWQYEVIGNIHDNPELLKGGNNGERL